MHKIYNWCDIPQDYIYIHRYICMHTIYMHCINMCACVHTHMYMCKSEDNFWESVHCSHHVCPRDQTHFKLLKKSIFISWLIFQCQLCNFWTQTLQMILCCNVKCLDKPLDSLSVFMLCIHGWFIKYMIQKIREIVFWS